MSPRRSVVVLILCLLVCPALCLASFNPLAKLRRERYVPGELLVKFRPGVKAETVIRQHGASSKGIIPHTTIHRLIIPQNKTVEQATAEFSRNPNVLYAGPNHKIYANLDPEDDLFYFQWGLYNGDGRYDIWAPEAWDLSTGSESTVIAIVDTGIDSSHFDLVDKVIDGWNPMNNTSNTEDDHMHGSFVAGIAAASTDNIDGMAGVDWNAKLMPIKVLGGDGSGDEATAGTGIIWAADHGAKIINMSFGTYLNVPALEEAVNYAWNAGCLVVAASGNDNYDDAEDPHYPSYYPVTISVGATNETDARCTETDWLEGGSNYGDTLDVMAPGSNIISCVPTWYETWFFEGFEIMSGTSAAAPFVSGLAGLIWAAHPDWSNQRVRDQIEQTCDDLETMGWDRYTGWGRINAYRALSEAFDDFPTIGSLRNATPGRFVRLPARQVTAGTDSLGDRFYIEESDRSAGIMVYTGFSPSTSVSMDDMVEVTGRLSDMGGDLDIAGERAIVSARVAVVGTATQPLRPLGLYSRYVGGQLGDYDGVTGGLGLSNTGLLVKTWGKVMSKGWNYFYVDDGYHLLDGSGFQGLKVYTGTAPTVKAGDIVGITGISTLEVPQGAGVRIRVVRPRSTADVVKLN